MLRTRQRAALWLARGRWQAPHRVLLLLLLFRNDPIGCCYRLTLTSPELYTLTALLSQHLCGCILSAAQKYIPGFTGGEAGVG